MSAARYPLAFDQNGNPLDVPAAAVAWRVRRGGGRRGRPRNVFNPETGLQLEVPLGATLDELINAGCEGDRYLLYPIDGDGRILPGVVGVTEVPTSEEDDQEDSAQPRAVPDESYVGQLLATIKAQADALCRAIESTSSGYGNVRPPVPVTIEAPAPVAKDDGGAFKPENLATIMTMAKTVFDALKGAGIATPPESSPSGGGS